MQVFSSELLSAPPLLNLNALLCHPSFEYSQVPSRQFNSARRTTRRVGSRVLLVGLIRELALYRAEVLRNYGYRVSIPETVQDAISIIQSGDFDAAVLSYTLPNKEVQELADLVRESCPNCPIVAISDRSRVDRRIEPDAIAIAQEGPPGLIEALNRVLRLPR